MKIACFSLTVAVIMCIAVALSETASAAPDNIYNLSEVIPAPAWDGAGTTLLQGNAVSGDESVITYNLPWTFKFYGQNFSSITADTNGNIWFGSAGPAHNFTLSTNTGHVPVIAAWNDDLSSSFYGGVFIQQKSNPDRVVVEWRTETYTDAGLFVPNNFETILFADNRVRVDYRTISTSSGTDSGSGISRGDGVYYDISSNFAPVYNLLSSNPDLSRSFEYAVQTRNLQLSFAGTGGGTITVNPYGTSYSANYTGAFPVTDTLTLHLSANEYSTLTGWTAGPCSGTGDCTVPMTSDVSATASFSLNTANSTRIDRGGNTDYYSSIQAAYNASTDNDTIKLWAVTYSEDLNCNLPKTITLQGGYNVGYGSIVGEPVLNGSLTIADGTVISDGLAIR